MRRVWLVASLIVLTSVAVTATESTDNRIGDAECGDVYGLGFACETPDGYRIPGDHPAIRYHLDPVPDSEADAAEVLPPRAVPRKPHCVDHDVVPDEEPRALVMYTRAYDDDDRFQAKVETIRNLVRASNGLVFDAATKNGDAVTIKVDCTDGEITVLNVVLPTPRAATNFNTIQRDLSALGHSDTALKYWIYHDDRGACRCGGIATLALDDRLTPANLNNGWVFVQRAVTFGYDSTRIMLHELGHTLGAVQTSAPHTTGAGHCTDGRDIMCYNDGGPSAGSYTNGACDSQVWDCGQDDYFNTDPQNGNYLANHWNLGSRWNRFFHFHDTVDLPFMDLPTAA